MNNYLIVGRGHLTNEATAVYTMLLGRSRVPAMYPTASDAWIAYRTLQELSGSPRLDKCLTWNVEHVDRVANDLPELTNNSEAFQCADY